MALNMSPERRRKLLAAEQARREWEDRHGVLDTGDEAADGTPENARQPTAEQYAELERTRREIFGMDPETGRYLD